MGQVVPSNEWKSTFLPGADSSGWSLEQKRSGIHCKSQAVGLVSSHFITLTSSSKKLQGFLRSRFLIDLGSQFIHDASLSVIDFGYPRGLFVLILTAVRCFQPSGLASTHRHVAV